MSERSQQSSNLKDDGYINKTIAKNHSLSSYFSTNLSNRFGNAIISAPQYSETVLSILLKMAMMIKKNHLIIQINQTVKSDKINKIQHPMKFHENNLKIDKALKYHKAGKISLDMKCNMLDPIWRTGIDSSQPANKNYQSHLRHRRIDKTVEMTGPNVYARFFNLYSLGYLPEKIQIHSRNNLLFKEVDASAKWSATNWHKKKK
ncbi:hypothetical protein [Xenorhabdus lircayensis]|uniref:Uncharacterized protein n=1 Tax=Xenorhabdus lircayensis TaxID=2763499 RepID=A0ABS0U4R9_9GAMM|nr:hypothetical protein [Xenorhabdus lircayensis]MBI6548878.1 hypothetical protein [Xenorhabdus lircayensis]